MKIGLFIDSFYPMVDGVINVVDNYAKELLKYGEVVLKGANRSEFEAKMLKELNKNCTL